MEIYLDQLSELETNPLIWMLIAVFTILGTFAMYVVLEKKNIPKKNSDRVKSNRVILSFFAALLINLIALPLFLATTMFEK